MWCMHMCSHLWDVAVLCSPDLLTFPLVQPKAACSFGSEAREESGERRERGER